MSDDLVSSLLTRIAEIEALTRGADQHVYGAAVTAGCCPNCRAEYPDFHSPEGTVETVCDHCGWASDEGREHEDVRILGGSQ